MIYHLTPAQPLPGYGEVLLPLAAAKAYLRIDDHDQDDLIAALRDAAIDMVEQYTALMLLPRIGMVATFAGFDGVMRLGVGPTWTVGVTGISYLGHDGAVAIAAGGWRVAAGARLEPGHAMYWPRDAYEVSVTFNVGFPAGSAPPVLIQAARMFMAHLFDNREGVVLGEVVNELPLGFTALCDQYRLRSI